MLHEKTKDNKRPPRAADLERRKQQLITRLLRGSRRRLWKPSKVTKGTFTLVRSKADRTKVNVPLEKKTAAGFPWPPRIDLLRSVD